MVRGARECRNGIHMPNFFLQIHKVHFRGPVGSIEGPRLVLDPREVRSGVP